MDKGRHGCLRGVTSCAPPPPFYLCQVLMTGLITALGIALHNFPEGVAVFLASMKVRLIRLQTGQA